MAHEVAGAHVDLSTAHDCFLDGGEADPFLFQADRRGVGVRDQVGAEG